MALQVQLRRSQRVSQSNLRRRSLSDCTIASQSEENPGPVTTVQDQYPNQSSQSQNSGSIVENSTNIEIRQYDLNKEKSLNKKLADCLNENVKIRRKARNNLTLEFSSAAYEIAKSKISSIVQSEKFVKEKRVKVERAQDINAAEAETSCQ